MSEHNHTPGPWSVSGRCGPDFTGKGNGDYYCYVCNEDAAQVVATVWNFSGCGEANAALISAAPELLECCEIACMKCMNEGGVKECDRCKFYRAIQKAKGELKP